MPQQLDCRYSCDNILHGKWHVKWSLKICPNILTSPSHSCLVVLAARMVHISSLSVLLVSAGSYPQVGSCFQVVLASSCALQVELHLRSPLGGGMILLHNRMLL